MREFHVLNLGAGVQSTTVALMYCTGFLSRWIPKIDVAIFADTQEEPRGEKISVYNHLAWLISKTSAHFPTLIRTAGNLGNNLLNGANVSGERFVSIPAFTSSGDGKREGMTRRQCTKEYKTEVIERAIRRDVIGLKPGERVSRDVIVHQYLGLSFDEPARIFGRGNKPGAKARIESRRYARAHFPLFEMFLTREMCRAWLEQQNIPHEVPRSACTFCPYHSNEEWRRLRESPEDWARAVAIDEGLRRPGNVINRQMDQQMYVHRSCVPLAEADLSSPDPRPAQQDLNFSALECEGMCGL